MGRYTVSGGWIRGLRAARDARYWSRDQPCGTAANGKFDDSSGRDTYGTESGANRRRSVRRADAGPATACAYASIYGD